jgi:hypothetical protein
MIKLAEALGTQETRLWGNDIIIWKGEVVFSFMEQSEKRLDIQPGREQFLAV